MPTYTIIFRDNNKFGQQFINLSNRLTKHSGKTKEGLTKSFCEVQYDLIIDMLSNWYYIKVAFKRIFKNQPKAVSDPTLKEEMDGAESNISDLIMQIKETVLIVLKAFGIMTEFSKKRREE